MGAAANVAAESHARCALTTSAHLPVPWPRAAAVQMRALVALGRAPEACAVAETVFARLPQAGGFGHGELEVRLAAALAFWAARDEARARELLASCREQVRVRSEDIPAGPDRERYLTRNAACVETVQLSQAWAEA